VYFTLLIEIEPMNPLAYMRAAEAYIGLGQRDNAINILRRGLEQTEDADIVWAWVNIDPDNPKFRQN
jgi:predicted Zn-dependent protease